jgi:hypothetical protein
MLELLDSLPNNAASSKSLSSSSVDVYNDNTNDGNNSSDPVGQEDKSLEMTNKDNNTTSLDAFVSVENSTENPIPKNSSTCSIILFYYPWCIFSAKAAPHFNAIGRLFPGLNVLALDAYTNNG